MAQGVGMKWLKRGNFGARCTLGRVSNTLVSERWAFLWIQVEMGIGDSQLTRVYCPFPSLTWALPLTMGPCTGEECWGGGAGRQVATQDRTSQ